MTFNPSCSQPEEAPRPRFLCCDHKSTVLSWWLNERTQMLAQGGFFHEAEALVWEFAPPSEE